MFKSVLQNVNECVAKMLQNEIKTYLQTYQQREGISAKWLKLKFKKTKKNFGYKELQASTNEYIWREKKFNLDSQRLINNDILYSGFSL